MKKVSKKLIAVLIVIAMAAMLCADVLATGGGGINTSGEVKPCCEDYPHSEPIPDADDESPWPVEPLEYEYTDENGCAHYTSHIHWITTYNDGHVEHCDCYFKDMIKK